MSNHCIDDTDNNVDCGDSCNTDGCRDDNKADPDSSSHGWNTLDLLKWKPELWIP